jgi:hypothetical protein
MGVDAHMAGVERYGNPYGRKRLLILKSAHQLRRISEFVLTAALIDKEKPYQYMPRRK